MRKSLLFTFLTLFLVGCDFINTEVKTIVEPEKKSLSLSIPFSPTSNFAQVAEKAVLTVKLDTAVVVEKVLTLTDSTVEGQVDNLLAGNKYTFTLSIFNAQNKIAYTGTAQADIIANEIVQVNIELKATTGSAIIIGTIVEGETGPSVTYMGEKYIRETFVTGSLSGSGGAWYNSNYGASRWMHVGCYDDASHMKGLIAFNLSAEQSANIESAKIKLTTDLWQDKHISAPVSIEIYPMISSWVEGTGGESSYSGLGEGTSNSVAINGATAVESSFGTPWVSEFIGLGADADTNLIATSTPHSASDGRVVWEFDISANCSPEQLAKGYVLVMKDIPVEGGAYYDYPKIATSEHPAAAVDGPRLVIEYKE